MIDTCHPAQSQAPHNCSSNGGSLKQFARTIEYSDRVGRLIYGALPREIEIDDRPLAHLKVAIVSKLRRSESFTLSWDHGKARGGGRSTIWLHQSIPLRFDFDGSRPPVLNRAWIELLMVAANSTEGLQLVPEPEGSINTQLVG